MASGFGELGINLQSMALYLVNFGVLFFVLRHFLGKKVLSLLDERRERISQSLQAAEVLQKEVTGERAKLAEEMKRMHQQVAEETRVLQKQLAEERARALAEIETYRTESFARAEQEALQMRERLFRDLQGELRSAVSEMTFRILGKHVSPYDE